MQALFASWKVFDEILDVLREELRDARRQASATVWVPIQLGLIAVAALLGWAHRPA